MLSNVVYKFTCQDDPEVSYIGETKRHFITRMKVYLDIKKSSKSKVKTHINCYHCRKHASYDSFEVIKKCQNYFSTLIHETLIIRHKDPLLNKQLFQKGCSFTLQIFP